MNPMQIADLGEWFTSHQCSAQQEELGMSLLLLVLSIFTGLVIQFV